jgi:hypothetical protein
MLTSISIDSNREFSSSPKSINYFWREYQTGPMTETDVQWLTYHFNIEYMFHVALDQLHHIDDNHDEIDLVNKFVVI